MKYVIQCATAVLALSLLAGCDAVDRARGRTADAGAAGGTVSLNLESPGVVRAGENVAIRLAILNRTDTVITRLRAELFLPAWLEPLPPTHDGASVTMVSSGEGTRLTYPIAEPPLAPGEVRTVVQQVRVPTGDWSGADISPSRTIRAWLTDLHGQPIGAELTTDLAVEGVGGGDVGGPDGTAAARVTDDAVGPVRLGMTAAELRQQVPDARDTTWAAEGMTERGLVAEPGETGAAGVPVLARLADGRVDQIRVRGPEARTEQGLGVGSRMEELRAAYGEPCAGTAEDGSLVVWFSRRPGISFVLDTPPAASRDELRRDPARIPGSTPVRELFVRRGVDGC